MTLILWWQHSRRLNRAKRKKTGITRKPDPSVALKRLHLACKNHNAQAAKQALLEWAAARWPDQHFYSLDAVGHKLDDRLKLQLRILSDYLYKQSSGDWSGDDLWQLLAHWRTADESKTPKSDPVLQPLHRI
jgi:hypothetical protein